MTRWAYLVLAAATVTGCGSADAHKRPTVAGNVTSNMADSLCANNDENVEIMEYDTSGDNHPDVRKLFVTLGEAPFERRIMVCREADLDANGTKDIVRFYDSDGRPLKEEADRNFDGRIDEITTFAEGRIAQIQSDTDYDGRIETRVLYEEGKALRIERDMAGRSQPGQWQPDTWEYFEAGRLVRAGTDLDGDGRVDRWDRNESLLPKPGTQRVVEESDEPTPTDG